MCAVILHLEVLLHLNVVMLHLEVSLHDCELNHNASDEENQVYEKESSPVQFCRLKKISFKLAGFSSTLNRRIGRRT